MSLRSSLPTVYKIGGAISRVIGGHSAAHSRAITIGALTAARDVPKTLLKPQHMIDFTQAGWLEISRQRWNAEKPEMVTGPNTMSKQAAADASLSDQTAYFDRPRPVAGAPVVTGSNWSTYLPAGGASSRLSDRPMVTGPNTDSVSRQSSVPLFKISPRWLGNRSFRVSDQDLRALTTITDGDQMGLPRGWAKSVRDGIRSSDPRERAEWMNVLSWYKFLHPIRTFLSLLGRK